MITTSSGDLGFGSTSLVCVALNLRQDLDVGNLGDFLVLHANLDVLDNLQHADSAIVLVDLVLEPVRNGGLSRSVFILILVDVKLALSRGSLKTLCLSLSRLESPVLENTITTAVVSHVVITPVLDPLDLLQNQIDLSQGICVNIAIARSLVVLSTVMHPNVSRDGLGAKLIATK